MLSDAIDPWVVQHLTEYEGKALVDAARADLSIPEDEDDSSKSEDDDEHKALLEKVREVLKDRVETVKVSRRLSESAACVVAAEDELNPQMRRLLEASGQAVPESKPILEINIDHPLVARLSDESDDARFSELSNIVLDHALLAEGSQLENPAEYVQRMNQLLLRMDRANTDA